MRKRLFAALLAAAMALSTVGCSGQQGAETAAESKSVGSESEYTGAASETEAVSYTAGTYTGTATGMDGEIKVAVTFSENAITDIEIVDDNETAGVGDKALTLIADSVLKNQSLDVDSVAGATISSAAMKLAIADAAEQAGANASDLRAVEVVKESEDETFDYDVVVVGSGLAGLTAAAQASREGAKVALVEKLGILGGTALFSSGVFLASSEQDGIDELTQNWIARNKLQVENPMDEEKVRSLVSVSPEVCALYKDAGLDFTISEQGFIKPAPSEKAAKNAESIKLASADATSKSGENIVSILSKYMDKVGVDVYLNTPVTSLQTEDGAVTGVVCETDHGVKTFNSKAVILCTGEYANNKELTEELCPEAAHNYTAASVGATGDGIIMARELGAAVYGYQESMSGVFCPDPYNMPVIGQPKNSYPYSSLLVTKDAERKVSETSGTHDQMIYFVCEGEADYGWVIMDEEIAQDYLNLDEYLQKTDAGSSYIKAYKADSIEALAEKMGVDAITLTATVERYNELCASGEDSDFGKDAKYLSAIDDGTYYAVKEYNCTRGNFGGIVISDKGEVVKEDGDTIPGLYAAGLIASGMYLGDYYPGGEALGMSAYMGYTSAVNAAAYAK